MLGMLALVFNLVCFVCWIFILIHAFKNGGVLQGILCFCIFPYTIYYAFAKFEHEKKNLIVAGYLGGLVLGLVLNFMARSG
jgi:hypothetical protein